MKPHLLPLAESLALLGASFAHARPGWRDMQ
jgi:hypothetical protein